MKTKEEYLLALDRIDNAYNNFDRSISAVGRFTQDFSLLLGLVNEHFEEKQETNLEHYFDDLLKAGSRFTFMNEKVENCDSVMCSKCSFCGDCAVKRFKWLASQYRKPTYNLTQFEFDLINTFGRCKECCLLNEIECLKKLSEKGYFKGINPFTKVHEIIENCEVVKDKE